MWSFLTGIGCAAVLAAVTLLVLDVGTITMVERGSDFSTKVEDVWQGGAQREGMIPETEPDG